MIKQFRLFACIAFAAMASCMHVFASRIETVCMAIKDVAVAAFKLARQEADGFAVEKLQITKAKAFTLRIEKRETPVVTSSWRMCPSV